MPEGFLSSHLVGGVAPGTVVRLAAPQGNFVMPDPAPASVLFITAGSGITPVMSMLRTLARRDQVTDIVHLHSAPTESDVMFASELADLERSHDGYRLRLRSTRTEGRLDLSRLDDEVPDWRERQTWACGPEGMLNDAERVWHRRTASRVNSIWSASPCRRPLHMARAARFSSPAVRRRSPWTERRR